MAGRRHRAKSPSEMRGRGRGRSGQRSYRSGNGDAGTGYSRYSRGPADASARSQQGARPRSAAGYARSDAQSGVNPQAAQYSRSTAASHYAGEHKKIKRHKTLKRVIVAVLVLLALAAAAAFAYVAHINANLNGGQDAGLSNVLVRSNITKEPFYMVLMGTDQSLERDQDGSTDDIYRTDTIMLARIDPVDKKVTLVSMPRDTQVNIQGYGKQKLNAAYAIGGASMAVQTVSDLSGKGISHYGLVDMDGLKEVVDDLGGIDVDVPMTIDDEDAGGHLDAGEQTLNGDQALILCRARHAYDQYGAGDDYRAANQRLVLSAIANKLLASDPATIASTVNSLSQYVKTDLSVTDIVALAQAMSGMDTDNDIYSAEMPTTSVYEDDLWYEKVDQSEWKKMMDRVDKGESPTEDSQVDAATGTVMSSAGGQSTGTNESTSTKAGTIVVRNGSGKTGAAASAAETLKGEGYSVGDAGNADSFNYTTTVVVYDDADDAQEAQDIAKTLGNAKAVRNDGSYMYSGDFLVVIGQDYSAS